MKLEISEEKSQLFDELETEAGKVLLDYLRGKREGGDNIVTARSVLNTMKGNRQTVTAREGLRFAMVDSLEDPDVRRKYVQTTQPDIRKLLPGNGQKKKSKKG